MPDVFACSLTVEKKEKKKGINYTPELLFQPTEVSTCAVALAVTLAAGSAAGCHGFRGRAPLPGSVAQSVGDHVPGGNGNTVKTRTVRLKRAVFMVKLYFLQHFPKVGRKRPLARIGYFN